MFLQGLDQATHMDLLEIALEENPPTPQHTKLLCSKLLQLLFCSHQSSAVVEVNFGDVASLYSKQVRTITIVNDTRMIFAFNLKRMNLKDEEDKSFRNFQIGTENNERDFTLFPENTLDLHVSFDCNQLNCFLFDYYELWFHVINNNNDSEYCTEEEKCDKLRSNTEEIVQNETNNNNTYKKAKFDKIRKLKEIKNNIIAKQVCEISNKINETIEKSIKLNLSGVYMSPNVYASKNIIKIQGSQKKSFKIFNDTKTKSAYIQISIDASNCPIRFSRLCAVIKPKSSISIDVSLRLNLFVSEYFYKTVFISVLNHAPLRMNVYACFHTDYNIKTIDSMDTFLNFKNAADKISMSDENECLDDVILDEIHYIKNIDSGENELHQHQSITDGRKDSVLTLESFFGINTEKYFTIQPNYLHLNRSEYRKHFIVKNKLNLKLFIIWNKDHSEILRVDPCSFVINENDSAIFNVEFIYDKQEVFLRMELDCTVYFGENMVEIILNQDKYEERGKRLEYFLPYSSCVKLCAHSFSNGYSWIPKYAINQEQFTFQFLLNHNKQTSMAYSSILIKNCGNLPLHYSINKMKSKFYTFETNPNCNYIQNNKEDYQNFHIIYAYLHLKQELPVSYLKRNFTLCFNADDMYNETKVFEIYATSDTLKLTAPQSLMRERDMIHETCEPVQEEQEMSIEIPTTATKSAIKTLNAANVPTDPDIDFEIPNISFLIEKTECWDIDITEYIVVTFPQIHPRCCTSVHLPLYNSSQHIIFYEFEVISEVSSLHLSSEAKDAFSIEKPIGHALSNQLVEVKCFYRPLECREYHQVLRCTQSCLLEDVKIAHLYFLLKGTCVESVINCHPTEMILGPVQCQFNINGAFELNNTENCEVNFLLRCTIESENETESTVSSEISNYHCSKSVTMESSKLLVKNNETSKCPKIQKKASLSKCATGKLELYENLVRKIENMDRKKCLPPDYRKNNVAISSDNDSKKTPELHGDNGIDDSNSGMCDLMFVDSLELCSDNKILSNALQRDFIILDPSIDVLRGHESTIIHFSYHPFTSGKHRLKIKLFFLESCPEDNISEVRYNKTHPLELLSIDYTCMESCLQIVDINVIKNCRSKCYSSCDYFSNHLNIRKLNEKLECIESLRISHEFNLPNFETEKELSFELVLKNMHYSRHLHMIQLGDGICNGCLAKNLMEHTSQRVCKHFLKHVQITPKEMEFGDENIWKFAINYGEVSFVRYIQENTGDSVVEFRTQFCLYVDNDSHTLCVVKKYLHLIIRLCPMVPGTYPDSFLLPLGVTRLTLTRDASNEVLQRFMRGNPEFCQIEVKFYEYNSLYNSSHIEQFWLYNNTSLEVDIYVKIVPKYRNFVHILMESFTIERNSKYPIMFEINKNEFFNHFHFELTDHITRKLRNIKVNLHKNEDVSKTQKPYNEDVYLYSQSILSRNPLIIHPIPLHHTTKRKITLQNIYDETVIFNCESILIHGVIHLDMEPKFGTLKPLQCKQMDLIVQSLSHATKMDLVLIVELYKEKHYLKYFDTLEELVNAERRRNDLSDSGSGDGATYIEMDIEAYRIHAQPKPNIQTIGVKITTYDPFNQTGNEDYASVQTKINSKLSEQFKTTFPPSSELKQNKSILRDLKNIFSDILWYGIGIISCENIKPITYEDIKNPKPPCENSPAKSSIEEIFDVIFEKFLYKNLCSDKVIEAEKSESFEEKIEVIQDIKYVNSASENQISFASLKNLVIRSMKEELAKQSGHQKEKESQVLSLQDLKDDSVISIDILEDEDSDEKITFGHDLSKKKNSIGINNAYFYDILTGKNVSW